MILKIFNNPLLIPNLGDKMYAGKFIVFEGLDGAGTTTQAKELVSYLFDKGKHFVPILTREPTSHTVYGLEIRRRLKRELLPHEMEIHTFDYWANLFINDRKWHLDKVVVPNLKNAPINGATRWINPKKALLQMSIRNKYADIFWFSLFHELGHIIHHSKKTINIDFAENRTGLPKEESEADLFASNSLIPSKNYEEFTTTGNFSIVAIKEFAKKLGIDSDIVIGRLQHDGLLPYKLNIHKSRFEWVKES